MRIESFLLVLGIVFTTSRIALCQNTWIKVLGGGGSDYVDQVQAFMDRGFIIYGWGHPSGGDFGVAGSNQFVARVDLNGRLLWKRAVTGFSDGWLIQSDSGLSIVFVGRVRAYNPGEFISPYGIRGKGRDDIYAVAFDGSGTLLWETIIGGTDAEIPSACIPDGEGGFIVAGYTTSSDGDFVRMNKGVADAFLLRVDGSGNIRWKKTYGGTAFDGAYAMVKVKDDYVVTGETSSYDGDFTRNTRYFPETTDRFLLRIGKNGQLRSRPIGLTDSVYRSLLGQSAEYLTNTKTRSYCSNGSVVLQTFSSNDPYDTKPSDLIVSHIDSLGITIWKQTFPGEDWGGMQAIVTTSNGDYLLTGSTTSDDGDFEGLNKGADDVFLARLDTAGSVRWIKTFGGRGKDVGKFVYESSDGYIYLIGETESDPGDEHNDGDFDGLGKGHRDATFGSSDIFIIKTDANGNVEPKQPGK